MPDDAVMDAAVETDVDPGLDTGAEESSQPEIAEPQQVGEPGKAIEAPKPLVDGGKLSQEAKETLEKIKGENPALARAIQRALFKEAEFQRELPGGLKDLRELRQTVETLGGPNGIQEIQNEVNGWHQFDEQYMAGDPKAVEFMTSEPEGQEAFLKLIPSAIQKYEQLHPEGYRNYMAQVFNATANQSDVPLTLMRLADLVGDNPRAMEQLQRLDGFFKFIKGEASKQVEAPKFEKQAPDTRLSELDQREAQLVEKEWNRKSAWQQEAPYNKEWDRLSAGRTLTDGNKEAIKYFYEKEMSKVKEANLDTLKRYGAARDEVGFLRFCASLDEKNIPRALSTAFDKVLGPKRGPKSFASSASAPAKNGAPAKGMPIAAGFKDIGRQPNYGTEVDLKNPFNSIAKFREGMAILKDGTKARWKKA